MTWVEGRVHAAARKSLLDRLEDVSTAGAQVDYLVPGMHHFEIGRSDFLEKCLIWLVQDHAGAAVFLASSDSDFVVAQTLNVDGGNWMS